MGIERFECISVSECCWDEGQCYHPDNTFACLEQGGTCVSETNTNCNRGITTNADEPYICPEVTHNIRDK